MIRLAVLLFMVLALFMIAGVIPVENHAQTVVFRTPLFLALLAGTGLLSTLACARYGRSLRRLPFCLAHLGVACILAGAGVGAGWGTHGHLALPVGNWHATDRLPVSEGDAGVPLGFRLSVNDFRVDHYDPTYLLYRPKTSEPRSADDYEFHAELSPTGEGTLRVGGFGEVPRQDLWDAASSNWIEQVRLANGWVLQRGRQTPREFEAVLGIDLAGVVSTRILRVNHPQTVNGWRIYLMSYNTKPQSVVQLYLRRDPGRWSVLAGIWAVIAGVAAMCWRRSASKEVPRVA